MIPAIPGTNCWTIAEDNLVAQLVQLPSVLSFLGVVDAAAAKAGNMYLSSLGHDGKVKTPAAWSLLFPNILIRSPGNAPALEATRVATGPVASTSGTIEAQFAILLSEDPEQEAEQERNFANQLGDVFDEFISSEVILNWASISLIGYGRNTEVSNEEVMVMQSGTFQIDWGLQGDE